MELSKSFAIIGAGNGGQAFAAYLSLKGYPVKIYDVSQKTIDILQEKGGVLLEGNSDVVGFGKITLASTNLKEVIHGADIVMVVLPSIYHKDMAKKMAPYLKDGQIVVLNPNASLGPVEFKNTLKECGCTADVILAGTSTLLFACRHKFSSQHQNQVFFLFRVLLEVYNHHSESIFQHHDHIRNQSFAHKVLFVLQQLHCCS